MILIVAVIQEVDSKLIRSMLQSMTNGANKYSIQILESDYMKVEQAELIYNKYLRTSLCN